MSSSAKHHCHHSAKKNKKINKLNSGVREKEPRQKVKSDDEEHDDGGDADEEHGDGGG